MEKRGLLYEGKAKRIYATNEDAVVWVEYKDSATAFNGVKKSDIKGKGVLNNEISSLLFSLLKGRGIHNHFIERISENEQLVQKVSIIPLEVVVRNVMAGSLSKRLGVEEGTPLETPIVEFYLKNDELGDPLVNTDHIQALKIASLQELDILKTQALKVNEELIELFQNTGIRLIDFKLEFGKNAEGLILLSDEISPDTCRLWDAKTNARLDKDIFRRDLGDLREGYQEILNRLRGAASHV